MKRILLSISVILISIAAHPGGASALWPENGLMVCTDPGGQSTNRIVSDGAGGAIVIWTDFRATNHDIYAQRVDGHGNTLWAADGIPVVALSGSQELFNAVSDGEGGAILVWTDNRSGNYDIYAQRIGPGGNPLWKENGVAVCVNLAWQVGPDLVSDGTGGAIIAWWDYRTGSSRVFAQRVDSGGDPAWTADGIQLCTYATGDQEWFDMAPDGSLGAYVVWRDSRDSDWGIYGQRISNGGTIRWSSAGQQICTLTGYKENPAVILDDAGGCLVAWSDSRPASARIFVQRLNSSGARMWDTYGVPLSSGSNPANYPALVPDGSGGAIVSWEELISYPQYDLYAQRILTGGTASWTAGGVPICTAAGAQKQPRIVSDGLGGAIVAWSDNRNLLSYDEYAQRVDGSGTILWIPDGVPLCLKGEDQETPSIATDGENGAIVSFRDLRYGSDITVQRIERNGNWGYPAAVIAGMRDVPGDQGGYVNLSWDASRLDVFPEDRISEYSVWRAISLESPPQACGEAGGGATAITGSIEEAIEARGLIAAAGYYWSYIKSVESSLYVDDYSTTVPTLFDSTSASTEYHYFMVIAHQSDPVEYWISPIDSGYSVDNLAPWPLFGLAAEQSYDPQGLSLTWDPSAASDLGCYRIYRGTSTDFVPGPDNLVASLSDTFYFDDEWRWDAGFWYKVAAVDEHENQGGLAVLGPAVITGGEIPHAPEASYLSQNRPNPFNPSTSITFGLNEPARVRLGIYDTAGRLVRVLLDERKGAGSHTVVWDGAGAHGGTVASGVYFCRIEAGSLRETRKMVLLR